jgi:hypothetical protein
LFYLDAGRYPTSSARQAGTRITLQGRSTPSIKLEIVGVTRDSRPDRADRAVHFTHAKFHAPPRAPGERFPDQVRFCSGHMSMSNLFTAFLAVERSPPGGNPLWALPLKQLSIIGSGRFFRPRAAPHHGDLYGSGGGSDAAPKQ